MNPHPLVVHFPIALLTLYSIFELIRVRRLVANDEWRTTKAIMVLIGTLGASAAIVTGKYIEGQLEPSGLIANVVEAHERAAFTTIVLYALPTIAYLLFLLNRFGAVLSRRMPRLLDRIVLFGIGYTQHWVASLVAIIALLTLIITGSLGAALVHGPDIDPVVHFIYHLLI